MISKIKAILKKLLIIGAVGLLIALLVPVGIYFYLADDLPRVETLSDYRPPIVTRVFSEDGQLIAEYSKERRILFPVEQMPRQLIDAFVAAEDSHFFEHQGIDFTSILRAAIKNIKAGGIVQGGSTITQQVAKTLLLSSERKFKRKFKEAILAWRMEQHLTKNEILYLYLNQIYLGHRAYGVQAAAENYFAKDVNQLTVAECAILAGLPQAPSRYSPYSHLDRAKKRQRYVLNRMVEDGYISAAEAESAFAQELEIQPRINRNIEDAAYFTEQVRRYLEERYGEEALYTEGLEVYTTMNLALQHAAQQAVQQNLRDHDRRQGYRGPEKVLPSAEIESFLAQQEVGRQGQPLLVGDVLDAVVSAADPAGFSVRCGPYAGVVTIDDEHWAAPLEIVANNIPAQGNADGRRTRLPIGAVIQVRISGADAAGVLQLELEQEPLAEGVIVAINPENGSVKTMVGGYDFKRSQFNRALQARRLPGSAIKPLLYAAALDKGYTPASIILDTPVVFKDKNVAGVETVWKPSNYSDKWYGPTSLRLALSKSRNIVTIKLLEDIGINYAAKYIAKFGIESPLTRDLTLALGSSALTPLELTTAYAVIANGGVSVTPVYVARVVNRDGKVIESIDPADFPDGPGSGQQLIRQGRKRVISPETAYLITNMMESVVQHGTGWRAKALKRAVAAKTGTTNDLKDAWFAGFVPQLVAVSWVGYDIERPLGKYETGSKAAAPAWVEFMREAVADLDLAPLNFRVPDTIEFHPVDPQTGLLAPEDGSDAYIEAFAPNTAPTRYALDEKHPQAQDFFRLDYEDL